VCVCVFVFDRSADVWKNVYFRFATVHKSKHKKTGKEYAVKVPHLPGLCRAGNHQMQNFGQVLEKGEWTLEERHLLAGEISILKVSHCFALHATGIFFAVFNFHPGRVLVASSPPVRHRVQGSF